jgi:predicted DNA binding CopG/RHH family protein
MTTKRPVIKRPPFPQVLDEEEEALSRSFLTDEWVDVTDPAELKKYSDWARASKADREAKLARTNIRLPGSDLTQIKLRAAELGIGYQTLIASLVHQYVAGNLIELSVVRRILGPKKQRKS